MKSKKGLPHKQGAPILKKTMTKSDFQEWSGKAEEIRDKALEEWEQDQKKPEIERAFDINAYVRELNCVE